MLIFSDTLKKLVHKYSQFINFNIYLWQSKTEMVDEEVEEEPKEKEDGAVEEEKEEKKVKKVGFLFSKIPPEKKIKKREKRPMNFDTKIQICLTSTLVFIVTAMVS